MSLTYIHTQLFTQTQSLFLSFSSSPSLVLSPSLEDTLTITNSAMNTAVLPDVRLQLELAGVSQMLPLRWN